MSTTTYDILETVSYKALQHATIAGYDLAYNKKRIMQKTITHPDGTQEVKDFTILTLVHKSRNGARAYLDHFTDGEWFTMMLKITGSYEASAKGMKNCYALIKQYLANPIDETVVA